MTSACANWAGDPAGRRHSPRPGGQLISRSSAFAVPGDDLRRARSSSWRRCRDRRDTGIGGDEDALRTADALREPGDGEISDEAITEAKLAFSAYGRALASAGVLLSADVLQPTAATTTVTRRQGTLRVQDGPFAETKEALAGFFLVDVPDLDAAIGWAEKCPGAQWGVVEVRPTATAFVDGAWTR